MSKRPALYPGWQMTHDQRRAYFSYLDRCYKVMGITSATEKEETRKLIHIRAFNAPISAKQIDRMKMFDAFKATCLAILSPNNLEAQIAIAKMETTRRIHRMVSLAPEAYWRSEAKRKFGHDNLEMLNLDQLTELRDHLCARASHITWPDRNVPDHRRESVGEPVGCNPDWSVP